MKKTKIGWCHMTGSPWLGCTEVSAGCGHCYARGLTETRLEPILRKAYKAAGLADWATRPVWGKTAPRVLSKGFFTDLLAANNRPFRCDRCGHGDLVTEWTGSPGEQCTKCGCSEKTRTRVFPSLMDWLDDCPAGVVDQDGNWLEPYEALDRFLRIVWQCGELTWILCTKRPENWRKLVEGLIVSKTDGTGRDGQYWQWLVEWLGGKPPKNIIQLASLELPDLDQRVADLLEIPAVCHSLSIEPLLGAVEIDQHLWKLPNPICANCPQDEDCECGFKTAKENGHKSLDWIIIGCESGKDRRYQLEYDVVAGHLIKVGAAAGIAVFHKQMPINGQVSTTPAEWPESFRVQQWPAGF